MVLLLCAVLSTGARAAAAAESVEAPHVTVSLVADADAVRPGEPFDAGIRFALEDGWHVYWSNPGDSGLAPSVRWTLPEGTAAGAIVWPHPEKIAVGPLANYGYAKEVLLPVRITPSAALQPGDVLNLAARVDWLVCQEDCIPGTRSSRCRCRWSRATSRRRAGRPTSRPCTRACRARRAGSRSRRCATTTASSCA